MKKNDIKTFFFFLVMLMIVCMEKKIRQAVEIALIMNVHWFNVLLNDV